MKARAGVLGTVAALTVASGCGSERPTAIVVAVTSEVRVPDDVDTIEIKVEADGTSKFNHTYYMPAKEASLPGTITVFNDAGDPSRPVTVTVNALLQDGGSRLVRKAKIRFAEEKQKLLRMPLRFSCLDFPKECAADETCRAGTCRKADVDVEALNDFDDGQVFAKPGACFDRSKCVPVDQTVDILKLLRMRDDCTFTVAELKALETSSMTTGFSPSSLNVGIVWSANTSGKWTAVDLDPEEGWWLGEENGGTVHVAPGLCDAAQGRLRAKDGSSLIAKAIANPVCPPKPPTLPECPPAPKP